MTRHYVNALIVLNKLVLIGATAGSPKSQCVKSIDKGTVLVYSGSIKIEVITMQKKEITVNRVDWVEGVPADFFILHGQKDNARVKFSIAPELILELAELYKAAGHAGHAIWHRDNKRPMPCELCRNK